MVQRKDVPTVNIVIEEETTYSVSEVCRACRLTGEELIAMVEEGLVQPYGETSAQWRFPASELQRVDTAVRLQHDLGVNLAGAALALELLDELGDLRRRVQLLERLLE